MPVGQARKNPYPVGVTAVTEASTAAAPSGIPQPLALPPWVAKPLPVPAIWYERVVFGAKTPPPPMRVSTTRHGLIGTYTAP